jgi:uncharacterized protein (TIGR04255 family)
MTAAVVALPFGSEPVDEIPLDRAPLVKVVAQIQFPRLSALLGNEETVNQYAAAIRDEYPILNEQNNVVVTISPDGVSQHPGPSKVWVLQSADDLWRIGVGDSALSIETSHYTDRADFCARFARAVDAFMAVVGVPYVSRLGVRYVNRLDEPDDVDHVSELFGSPVNGVLATKLPPGARVDQTLSQSVYSLEPNDGLLARWGLLPANAVVDPLLPPAPTPSFLLDLDAFRGYPNRGEPRSSEIVNDAAELAARAYRYFRWSVTEQFLERFGAKL